MISRKEKARKGSYNIAFSPGGRPEFMCFVGRAEHKQCLFCAIERDTLFARFAAVSGIFIDAVAQLRVGFRASERARVRFKVSGHHCLQPAAGYIFRRLGERTINNEARICGDAEFARTRCCPDYGFVFATWNIRDNEKMRVGHVKIVNSPATRRNSIYCCVLILSCIVEIYDSPRS